jgi:phosphoenolpyruvate carboxykinase (ATP)
LPLHPSVYGEMLQSLIRKHNVPCYLVNTGWSGGAYGEGQRMPLSLTRSLVKAALSGDVAKAEMRRDDNFGFAVPLAIAGVEGKVLDPKRCWADAKAYDVAAQKLLGLFADNFKRFEEAVQLIAAE